MDAGGDGLCLRTDLLTTTPSGCAASIGFGKNYSYCFKDLNQADTLQFLEDGRLTQGSKSGQTFYWEYNPDCSLKLYLAETLTAKYTDDTNTFEIDRADGDKDRLTSEEEGLQGKCVLSSPQLELPAGCTQSVEYGPTNYNICFNDIGQSG
jgi:hypothetical protein